MYTLRVITPGSETPAHIERLAAAGEVLASIPRLLDQHPGCERVEVYLGDARLFCVDCEGRTLP